jgi:hypothetical protein
MGVPIAKSVPTEVVMLLTLSRKGFDDLGKGKKKKVIRFDSLKNKIPDTCRLFKKNKRKNKIKQGWHLFIS